MNILERVKRVLSIRVSIVVVVGTAIACWIAGSYFTIRATQQPEMIRPPFPRSSEAAQFGGSRTLQMFQTIGLPTCSGFFALLPAGVGHATGKKSCADDLKSLSGRFEVWNEQMKNFNTTLAVYLNFPDAETVCKFNGYPHLEMIYFDAEAMFSRLNMSGAYTEMKTWPDRHTRVADVMRLLVAYETGKTYIDMDIFFLDKHALHFMYPFTGAAVFQDNKNAIEITNAAFCLPPSILERMLSFVTRRIELGSKEYFYTELGPSMFHKIMFNQYPAVALYSQNHPANADLDRVAREALLYSHRMLHLTGHVRKGHPELSFKQLTLAIQEKMVSLRKQLRYR